jgi:hypothetical protein
VRPAAADGVSEGPPRGAPTSSATTLQKALADHLNTVAQRRVETVSETVAGALGALRHTLSEAPQRRLGGATVEPCRHPPRSLAEVSRSNPASPVTTLPEASWATRPQSPQRLSTRSANIRAAPSSVESGTARPRHPGRPSQRSRCPSWSSGQVARGHRARRRPTPPRERVPKLSTRLSATRANSGRARAL